MGAFVNVHITRTRLIPKRCVHCNRLFFVKQTAHHDSGTYYVPFATKRKMEAVKTHALMQAKDIQSESLRWNILPQRCPFCHRFSYKMQKDIRFSAIVLGLALAVTAGLFMTRYIIIGSILAAVSTFLGLGILFTLRSYGLTPSEAQQWVKKNMEG